MTLPVAGVMLEPPALSTLVIDRSGVPTVSVSVAETGLPPDGVTVAVFVSVEPDVAVELTVPVTVYVIELPGGIVTLVSSMLPEPLAEKPVAAGRVVLVAVQVSLVKFGRHRIDDRDPGGSRPCRDW